VVGLTHQALAELLTEKGLNPELVERVGVCLTNAELGRFSPAANDPVHATTVLKEIEVLISDLERNI
jgi:hypothetical protein